MVLGKVSVRDLIDLTMEAEAAVPSAIGGAWNHREGPARVLRVPGPRGGRPSTGSYSMLRWPEPPPREIPFVRATVFRTVDAQPLPADERVRRSLKRRLLLDEEQGGCRLRVALMLRWLRERS